MADYRVISSDNHVFEPVDLWTSRAASKFKDRVPHIKRLEDGDWWFCDGKKVIGLSDGVQAGARFEETRSTSDGSASKSAWAESSSVNLRTTGTVEEIRPGGWIPEEHMKDMDEDGVDVSIVYPTAGLLLFSVPDSDLLTEIFRTYNDWLAEFCKPFPDRIKGIACLNIDDVKSGVKELERCANMGLAGGMITVSPPQGRAYNSPEYEPLWAAAQDLQMPLGLHIATNRPGPGQEFASVMDSMTPAFLCNSDHWVRMSLAHIIFNGVFHRYPKLQLGSVEMELSWIPHFLDRLDYTYTQRVPRSDWWGNYNGDLLPSEYFHRNVFAGFQEDGLGVQMREIIGVDNLMWGSDYPHVETTFPRSRQILEEVLADCTEEEKAKIVGGNAARVYNLN